MNPNKTVKLWLLACGKQYGIREAHDYRWPDPYSRQKEMYFEYRIVSSRPIQDGFQDMTTKTEHTAHRKKSQKWITVVEINLKESQNGMEELASCMVGGNSDPNVRAIFNDICSPPRYVSLENLSTFDDEEIIYHQQLICEFEEDITFELDEANAVVDEVEIDLDNMISN